MRTGVQKERLYACWSNIQQRTCNPRCRHFKHYGARGITMCQAWRNSYSDFRSYVMALPSYALGLTLDRIDNNRGYEPGNLRWVDLTLQASNRRSNRWIEHNGMRRTLGQWANAAGISHALLFYRIGKLGWSMDRALSTPSRQRTKAAERGAFLPDLSEST